MTHLVFFLEEHSAKEMLDGVLPKCLPDKTSYQCVVFEGKQDLEKQLPIKLKAWRHPSDVKFIVMRDQDSGDCLIIKDSLKKKCDEAGKPDVLIRIACRELESFYLGDLTAVASGIGPASLARLQNKKKYRNPDDLANPKQELKRIAPDYQNISGSRAIATRMEINNNRSPSFKALISGVRRIA